MFGRYAYSHTAPSGINERNKSTSAAKGTALSAAPTPTHFDSN
uniref:Uncharacterized protein n=1 Tax=Vibrio sp. FF_304 TaxID=1652833 RepID=A0A0H3ZXH9_9VIBR|nr:hypothetical protein [Vibrio sp. FF_304]